MKATINGVVYDSDNAMPFDDSCLGRVVDGYLWQILLVNPKENYFMFLTVLPENEHPCIAKLNDAELFALTKEQAIERYETRLFDRSKGSFKRYIAKDIREYLEEEAN